jgi:hypothetical protein
LRSITNASWRSFVSPGTRSVACEVNATKRPLALTPAVQLGRSPCCWLVETLTRVVRAVVADGAVDTSMSAARVMIVGAATFTAAPFVGDDR